MTQRSTLRHSAIAAMTALSAFAAHAIEATQWNPQDDVLAAASTEAMSAPDSWTAQIGEATQFRDARSEGAMLTRAAVREDLQLARRQGLLNDTGEAGATERVLAQREAFAAAEHERLVALNTPVSDDPIAAIADAAMNENMWDREAIGEMTLAQDLEREAPLPYESSVTPLAMAPLDERPVDADDVAAV
ncbi:MAG TPA: hypothetical protein VGE16_15845 [Albitalea sp.]